MNETMTGCFYDAITGETIVRDLTAEECAELIQLGWKMETTDKTPNTDDLVVVETPEEEP